MDLRLRNLEQLDSRAVPLPHGTEIVTRVDRIVGERRVPQGSVGRVTKIDGDTLDVNIVGIGVVCYARAEVSPRRVGQVLFAHRRADAWDALRPCVVLEATVGSRAWGLADEDSDIDRRGVFATPFTWTQGLVAPPEDLVSADGSTTYWGFGKTIRQALRADPNTLEMLFLDNAKPLDVIGEWLLGERDALRRRRVGCAKGCPHSRPRGICARGCSPSRRGRGRSWTSSTRPRRWRPTSNARRSNRRCRGALTSGVPMPSCVEGAKSWRADGGRESRARSAWMRRRRRRSYGASDDGARRRRTLPGAEASDGTRPRGGRSSFALNQLRFVEKEPTVKKLLYVLRTTLTGIHLLETQELEPDLTRLMDHYGLPDAASLVERKRAGERVGLDPTLLERWRPRVDALFARLDASRDISPLPDSPANESEVRAWLLAVRRAKLG